MNVPVNNDFYIVPGEPGTFPSLDSTDADRPFDVTAVIHNAQAYNVPAWDQLDSASRADPVLIVPAHRRLDVPQNPAILASFPRELDAEKNVWTATYLCAAHCFTNSMQMWTGDGPATMAHRIRREQQAIQRGRGHTGDVAWIKNGGVPIRQWLIT